MDTPKVVSEQPQETISERNVYITNKESLMEESLSLKDQGNASFSESNYIEAKKSYLKGLRIIKKLNDDEFKEIQKSFYLNLTLTYVLLKEHQNAIHSATNALRLDPNNVKALYRRGLAREDSEQFLEAKEDFSQVLQLNPTNSKAREHLHSVRRKIQSKGKDTKQIFGGFFSKNLELYKDKEFDHEEIDKKRKEKDDELYQEWLKNMEQKEGSIDVPLTFEKFKEMKTQEDKSPKEENSSKSVTPSPVRPISNRNSESVNSLSDLDEEEQKILNETKKMGYCYFHKELTEDEKKQKETFKPKLIQTSSTPNQMNISNNTSNKSLSSWNAAGTTYEEKDITNFAKELLKSTLINQNKEFPLSPTQSKLQENCDTYEILYCWGKIIDVKNITGESHIAAVRGTRRYFFDFSFTIVAQIGIIPVSQFDFNYNSNFPKFDIEYFLNEIHNLDDDSKANWTKDIEYSFSSNPPSELYMNLHLGANKFKEFFNESILNFVLNLKKSS